MKRQKRYKIELAINRDKYIYKEVIDLIIRIEQKNKNKN